MRNAFPRSCTLLELSQLQMPCFITMMCPFLSVRLWQIRLVQGIHALFWSSIAVSVLASGFQSSLCLFEAPWENTCWSWAHNLEVLCWLPDSYIFTVILAHWQPMPAYKQKLLVHKQKLTRRNSRLPRLFSSGVLDSSNEHRTRLQRGAFNGRGEN